MRTNYTIKNSLTAFISNIISFIFLFISQTIFIKILGIEYTGLNGLFNNILTFLNLFELGIGSAIIYNLYKYISKNDKETIKSLMSFYKKAYNIIALSILVVGLLITPFITYIIKETTIDINIYYVYILYIISTVSTYLIAYKRNLLYAYQKNYIINIIHVFYIIILNTIQLLIIYFTKNYYLYLIIKIICILLENIIISIKVNKDYPFILDKNIKKLNTSTKNDIITRVKALFIHKVSSVITYGTDNILISIFFGLETVGFYTSYYYIIYTIDTLFRNIILGTSASVGNLLTEDNYNKRYEVFNRIRFLNLWISIFTSICLFILLDPFITMWLGKDYLLSKIVVLSLIINYFQSMMRSTYNIFKDAAGIWVEDRFIPIIQSILNIVSSIICIYLFGLVGVFIGTIISTSVLWFYSYPKYVYKKILNKNYKDYYIDMIKSCSIFMILIILTYSISKIISINSLILEIVLKLLLCIIIPNIVLIIIYRKNTNFKYYLNLIKEKI